MKTTRSIIHPWFSPEYILHMISNTDDIIQKISSALINSKLSLVSKLWHKINSEILETYKLQKFIITNQTHLNIFNFKKMKKIMGIVINNNDKHHTPYTLTRNPFAEIIEINKKDETLISFVEALSEQSPKIKDWIFKLNNQTLPLKINSKAKAIRLWMHRNQNIFENIFEKNKKLTSPKIDLLSNLEEIYFGNNKLTSLPAEIGNLINLKELLLNNNNLTTLPPEIANLVNLENLVLDNNELEEIPSGIYQLSNLLELSLENNLLDKVPSQIGQLSSLKRLNVSSNGLTKLPPEIGNLINLEYLQLYTNELKKLPATIELLVKLKALLVGSNQLKIIAPEIFKLINLTCLDFNNNYLKVIPQEIGLLTNLEVLNLKNNQLTELPSQIVDLLKLKYFNLNNNNLHSLTAKKNLNQHTFELINSNGVTLPSIFSNLTIHSISLSFPSGAEYRGSLVNGRMEGKGRLKTPDKAIYKGTFINGKQHGRGTLTNPNGEKYIGNFVNDKLQGNCLITDTEGRDYLRIASNGRIQKVSICTGNILNNLSWID